MTPAEIMASRARHALEQGRDMVLTVPRPWRHRPVGFPRGKLLQEETTRYVYAFDPRRVLEWLTKYGLLPQEGEA